MPKSIVDLTVKLIRETDSAYLVTDDDRNREWIPKSQVEFFEEKKDGVYDLSIPEWLANEKGLI